MTYIENLNGSYSLFFKDAKQAAIAGVMTPVAPVLFEAILGYDPTTFSLVASLLVLPLTVPLAVSIETITATFTLLTLASMTITYPVALIVDQVVAS